MDLGKIRIAREIVIKLANMLNTTSKTFVLDIKIVQEMAKNFKVEISYFLDDDFYVSIDITPIVSNQ